ncbi:hypothetical protein O6H91_Y195000 [Diphasiastrum complanatum]|nr:hypothetical protein O6H91_Y195000 [Diphasiastrum complanatum]
MNHWIFGKTTGNVTRAPWETIIEMPPLLLQKQAADKSAEGRFRTARNLMPSLLTGRYSSLDGRALMKLPEKTENKKASLLSCPRGQMRGPALNPCSPVLQKCAARKPCSFKMQP